MLRFSSNALIILASFGLFACDSIKNPFASKEAPKLEGERKSILKDTNKLSVSDSLADLSISLPPAATINDWQQEGGNAQHNIAPIAANLNFTLTNSIKIGEGNGWSSALAPAPVVSQQAVFAMDAKGYISAHDRKDINQILWKSEAAANPESKLAGGGLALHDDKLYVATGAGDVLALESKNGKVIWKKSLRIPARSAPTISDTGVYVITANSEIFALDIATGELRWQHKGIQETANLLGAVPPALSENLVIANYPSGEIYALDQSDGSVRWQDSLLLPEHTQALGVFSGSGGAPILANGGVFSVSGNGLLAANVLETGLRIWERPLSSNCTPWLGGEFLYVISTTGELVATHARDGRIKWTSDISELIGKSPEIIAHTKGPYIIGGQLLVIPSKGEWLAFSPTDGKLTARYKVQDGIAAHAAFADNSLFAVMQNGTLIEVK